jgi:hypothetical protein
MSEAADAEREAEDFFNEEIFGAAPPVENDPAFPGDAPPESKPVEGIVTDTPPSDSPEGEPEVEAPAEDPDETVEIPAEGEVVDETPQEEEYLTWAKKQYGEDLDPEKLARAAWEKERLLGQKAESEKRLQEEAHRREVEGMLQALNTPGHLTNEEDNWVNEAILSGDPGEWAVHALRGERPDLYAAIRNRWSAQGEQEAQRAAILHTQVTQQALAPRVSVAESYALALGQTFQSVGLNIEEHGPLILAKLDELGAAHPAVRGIQSHDPEMRALAAQSVWDLISSSQTTVQKARTEDVVQQRVQEEQLRQNAAGVNGGSPHVEPPKKSKFWEEFEEETRERGWDGERPQYGRE